MRDTIRFLFGNKVQEIHNPAPTETVLEWLRREPRACGTKEGCAEGDCGACTIVLGEPAGRDGMRYRAVNACILFLPALDGRQLLTVEHLRAHDGSLHPVQQAMVEHHASQCGFCTPGFVMSLFALYHAGGAATRARVNEALAGNLCRCTGYRPIADAALIACAGPPADRFAATAAATAARLRTIADADLLVSARDGQRFFAPRTADELAEILVANPGATLLAGGTDVGLWVTKQHRVLPTVVSVERVAELTEITERDGMLVIGAAATYEDAFAALVRHWPQMAEMLRRLGSRQIRNRGTIGGNVANASPIGDMPPSLIALDATLVLRRGKAERRIAVEAFFRGYRQTALMDGEFLSRIEIPLPTLGDIFATYKVSKRRDQDISAVCGAFRLRRQGERVHDIRIGFGGMAAVPKRATATERALIGRAWDRASIAAATAVLDSEFAPITDMRASAAYRRLVARNLLLRFMLETTQDGSLPVRLQEIEEVPA